jgi:hypothetical protein
MTIPPAVGSSRHAACVAAGHYRSRHLAGL